MIGTINMRDAIKDSLTFRVIEAFTQSAILDPEKDVRELAIKGLSNNSLRAIRKKPIWKSALPVKRFDHLFSGRYNLLPFCGGKGGVAQLVRAHGSYP